MLIGNIQTIVLFGKKRIKGEEIQRQKTRYAGIVQEQIQEYGMHIKQYPADINITNTKITKALLKATQTIKVNNETQTMSRNPTANWTTNGVIKRSNT